MLKIKIIEQPMSDGHPATGVAIWSQEDVDDGRSAPMVLDALSSDHGVDFMLGLKALIENHTCEIVETV